MENIVKIKKGIDEETISRMDKETAILLFETGIPEFAEFHYFFDEHLFLQNDLIIFGTCNGYNVTVDLNTNESIYILYPQKKLFINSSLKQFTQYINLFKTFKQNIVQNSKLRKDFANEWKNSMIRIDKDAFYDKGYYWGAYLEEYENRILL